MGTRSCIAMQREDGKIAAIYCHWDGYYSYNGRILFEHYDAEKTKQLMELGNISSLGEEIGSKHSFNDSSPAYCTAYGRDREDEGEEATIYPTDTDWFASNDFCWCQYFYLFKDGEWYGTTDLGRGNFGRLADILQTVED